MFLKCVKIMFVAYALGSFLLFLPQTPQNIIIELVEIILRWILFLCTKPMTNVLEDVNLDLLRIASSRRIESTRKFLVGLSSDFNTRQSFDANQKTKILYKNSGRPLF